MCCPEIEPTDRRAGGAWKSRSEQRPQAKMRNLACCGFVGTGASGSRHFFDWLDLECFPRLLIHSRITWFQFGPELQK